MRKTIPSLSRTGSNQIAKVLYTEYRCKKVRKHRGQAIQFLPMAELREIFEQKHGKQDWPVEHDLEKKPAKPDLKVVEGGKKARKRRGGAAEPVAEGRLEF